MEKSARFSVAVPTTARRPHNPPEPQIFPAAGRIPSNRPADQWRAVLPIDDDLTGSLHGQQRLAALNPPDSGSRRLMPSPSSTPRELVDRLDARHEELIRKLDELNARIETTLAEFARTRDRSVHPSTAATALEKAA
jgi:hypothetical protein